MPNVIIVDIEFRISSIKNDLFIFLSATFDRNQSRTILFIYLELRGAFLRPTVLGKSV